MTPLFTSEMALRTPFRVEQPGPGRGNRPKVGPTGPHFEVLEWNLERARNEYENCSFSPYVKGAEIKRPKEIL